ncbi:hypothetical protein [Nocardia terpenica]|uniref:hypothetical protein n=1 Tax=Nocardia terpenica TaxID=455432 RepID=UPI000AA3F809|nr:hypothetical protein [Nocardia terpenica]NQE88329.1 hypothetical protein [Nocardia terpenica]
MSQPPSALLPTAEDLLDAMAGKPSDDQLLTAAAQMLPLNRQRYLAAGVLIHSALPAVDEIQRAGVLLTSAVVALSRLAYAIDYYAAERLRHIDTVPGTTQSAARLGEAAGWLAFVLARDATERALGGSRNGSELGELCDAYNGLRARLLSGQITLRPPGTPPDVL